MGEYKYYIHRYPRKLKGEAVKLYVRIGGEQYRETLGHNLSEEEANRRALQECHRIYQSLQQQPSGIPRSSGPTLGDAINLSMKMLKHKKCVEVGRPESVIRNHILPFFEHVAQGIDTKMSSLTAEHGLDFIQYRRESKAAESTIKREWGVLVRLCNLAESFWKIINPMRAVPGPSDEDRERIATLDELEAIREYAEEELWRFIVASLHIGLRETMMLSIEETWFSLQEDGGWLLTPKPATKYKRYLPKIPLNAIATAALFPDDKPIPTGRIFSKWETRSGVYQAFRRACDRAGVANLHLHDLKRTFGTWLEEEGVPFEIRQMLLGHRMPRPTKIYSQGGKKTQAKLRDAVTLLEKAYPLCTKSAQNIMSTIEGDVSC